MLARDGFGVGFPWWEAGWSKTYNLTGCSASPRARCARCMPRAASAPPGRRSRSACSATSPATSTTRSSSRPCRATRRSRRPPTPATSSIYPASYVALVLLLRARAGRIPSSLWLDGLDLGAGRRRARRRARLRRRREHRGLARGRRDEPRLPARRPRAPRVRHRRRSRSPAGGRAATWVLIALGFGLFAVDRHDLPLPGRRSAPTSRSRSSTRAGRRATCSSRSPRGSRQRRLDARSLRSGAMLVAAGRLGARRARRCCSSTTTSSSTTSPCGWRGVDRWPSSCASA